MKAKRTIFYTLSLFVYCSVAGCSSTPPLADHLTLIPVSDKADIANGLDMAYVYGTDEGIFNYVSCDQAQNCWYSGQLGFVNKTQARMNPLIIRTSANGAISWARSYEINDIYTRTNGLLPTRDGGALLYGNSIITNFSATLEKPIYEKLNSQGLPEWGGSVFIGGIKSWSAFSDAIHLADGGYALSGSGILGGKWSGSVLVLDAAGNERWLKFMRSQKDPTLSLYLSQLSSGNIMVAGYDVTLRDIVLFRFSADGKPVDVTIIHIRGREIPVGFVTLDTGPAIVAQQEMPSGESAAVVIRLDHSGEVKDAARYRYVDGFNPYDVISLPGHRVCIYGITEAHDNRKSLAFVLDAKGNPSSALALKGGSVFQSGALFAPDRLTFAGGRALGVDRRMSGLIVKWMPVIGNNSQTLTNIKRSPLKVTVYKNESGTVVIPTNSSLRKFSVSEMQSRLVSGGQSDGSVPAGP